MQQCTTYYIIFVLYLCVHFLKYLSEDVEGISQIIPSVTGHRTDRSMENGTRAPTSCGHDPNTNTNAITKLIETQMRKDIEINASITT